MKRLFLLFLLLPLLCHAQDASQHIYLVKKLRKNPDKANYAGIYKGQAIGVVGDNIALAFDKEMKSCRLISLSQDTIKVLRITSFMDTVITSNTRPSAPYSRPLDTTWEYSSQLSKHKHLIAEQYRKIIAADTLTIPLSSVHIIRSYRKQQLRGQGAGIVAIIIPPILAYLVISAAHPARDYSLLKWKPMYHTQFIND